VSEPSGKEPAGELLRTRQVTDWIGISICELRAAEDRGDITPFYKWPGAHPFYLKSEIIIFYEVVSANRPKEPKPFQRLFYVLEWLGITAKELRSLVDFGLIHPLRLGGEKGKFYYRTSEIKSLLEKRKRRQHSVADVKKTVAARARRWPK
jgi:hypothetical protein